MPLRTRPVALLRKTEIAHHVRSRPPLVRWYLGSVLTEAQIEIVDDAGHVEDRVRIVGTGEIALTTKDGPRLQMASDAPADVDAVIRLRDGAVTIEARKDQALRVDDAYLPMASPRDVPRRLIALV